MTNPVIRKDGSVLDEAAIEGLRAILRGGILRPGSDGYDEIRKIWNGLIDKRPSLIVRCAGAGDVVHSVRFARDHELVVSVRGGGHSIAGSSVSNDGLMIDLSPMKGIRVDPVRRTVRAQPGLKLGEFDRETQAFGLATTMGIATDTGIAGLTLGGGYGWLAGNFGLACDNLLSVDLVTAEGELITASERENADLFWGVRGGGATLALSPPSSTACIPLSRFWAVWCFITRARKFCASSMSSQVRARMRSAPLVCSSLRRTEVRRLPSSLVTAALWTREKKPSSLYEPSVPLSPT